jgi:hypothetical protein
MIYTHKIYEFGNAFPSDGEIIVDDNGNFLKVIETSQIHTKQWESNFVYALCEDVDEEDDEVGPDGDHVQQLYGISELNDDDEDEDEDEDETED